MTVRWLLINPPASSDHSQITIPLNLMVLSSVVKEAGGHAEVLDLDFMVKTGQVSLQDDFFGTVVRSLRDRSFTHVGVTTMCANYPVILEMCRFIKEAYPACTMVLGGPQASAVCMETLELFPFIDLIVVGEGERTVAELVRSGFSEVESQRGICYRSGEKIVSPLPQPMIDDLNELPIPDYGAIPLGAYISELAKTEIPVFPIEAGRGCPYNCTFCSTTLFWEKKYRVKSPERITDEIMQIYQQFGLTKYDLVHDNLLFDREYCLGMGKVFAERLPPEVTWIGASRADHIVPELLEALKAGRCGGLFFGIETGSPRMQKLIRKGLKLERVPEVIKMCTEAGIGSTASLIIGFPEEEPEDTNATLNLALQCKLHGARVDLQILSPVYETELFAKYGDKTFYVEDIQPRSAFPIDELAVGPLVRSNNRVFAFYYGFPHPHMDFEFLVFVNFLFMVFINNNPQGLWHYMQGNKTTFLDIAREHRGQVQVGSAISDKLEFFQQVYACYRLIQSRYSSPAGVA